MRLSTPNASPAPINVDAKGAAKLLGISESFVRKLDKCGKFPMPHRIGRKRFWIAEELIAWNKAGAPSRQVWAELQRTRAR